MKLLLILGILFILPIILIPVYASHDILLTTDKLEYSDGETIFINGTVVNYDPTLGRELVFYMFAPDEQIVVFETITEISDGSFEKTLVVSEPVFVLTGDYELLFQYGSDSGKITIKYLDGVSERIPTEFTITTDKSQYHKDETVFISGEVPIFIEGRGVTLELISPLGKRIGFGFQAPINVDKTFNYSIRISGHSLDAGIYTIRAMYDSGQIETTFEVLPPIIQVFTDKQSYHGIETIKITGQINNDTVIGSVRISLSDTNDSLIIPEVSIPITNNTFTHNITTDTQIWSDYIDDVTVKARITGFSDSVIISYSHYPLLSLESLYDMIDTNIVMINDMYGTIGTLEIENEQKDTIITTLTQTTILLQTQLEEMHIILEDFIEGSIILPMNPPIITSFTVNDPDDLDEIYSIDDTITITFDSDTNMPGGAISQHKHKVNQMFTFSESLGSAYKGTWVTPDTFVITIKSVKNAELIINSTTATPTGITPILPFNSSPTPSNSTSPVLGGDFGIP